MKRYFRQHLVVALALAALVPSLSFAQNKLVVAIQPTVASDEMLNKAKPLQQFMEKEPGGRTKVEVVGYLAKSMPTYSKAPIRKSWKRYAAPALPSFNWFAS